MTSQNSSVLANMASCFTNVSDFDFHKMDRLPNADLDVFRRIQAAFAEGLATELTGYLRKEFSISLSSVRQMSWRTYTEHFNAPSCLMVLRAQATPGIGTLEVGPAFVFTILEILLGGKSDSPLDTSRELTSIEKKLLAAFFRSVQRRLHAAWSTDGPDFVLDSVVSGPARVGGVSAEDPILLAEFLVKADGVDGHMGLTVPARFVRQRRLSPDSPPHLPTSLRHPEHTNRMLKQLQPGSVRVDTKLLHTTLRIADLAALQPGDLLNLGHPISSPVSLCVNGFETYSGFIVPIGDKRGFSIESIKAVNSDAV